MSHLPEHLDWSEIAGAPSPTTIATIQRAYGYEGLGILLVKNIPGLSDARAACLPQSRAIALLPQERKQAYEHKASFYSFGWSHGKENFNGNPDTSKGSFYFNPCHDTPEPSPEVYNTPALCPFLHPNIWPTQADLPGFEQGCKTLSRLMVEAGAALAHHVDAFVAHQSQAWGQDPPTPALTLHHIVTQSMTHKARLLYYFPTPGAAVGTEAATSATSTSSATPESPWCGAHNDHGSLTALTSAQFFRESTGEAIACPDPQAGLYIRTRGGDTVKVVIPPDCLAFQIGECAQVHSGGALQATPHWVKAPIGCPDVARATMAVFM
jgi:isopenicillin N synthase-like dioxygenase